ncbi:hypothetical protein Dimus_005092, partial [Dionaea muscipula]
EAEPADTETAEVGAANAKPAEAKAADTETAEAEPAKAEIVNTETAEVEAAKEEAVYTRPVEVEVVDTRPIEVEVVDTIPVEVEAIDTKPVEVETVYTRPIKIETVYTRPVEVNEPEQVDSTEKEKEKEAKIIDEEADEEVDPKDDHSCDVSRGENQTDKIVENVEEERVTDTDKEKHDDEDEIGNEDVVADEDEIETLDDVDADKVNAETKSTFVDKVLQEVMASIGKNDEPKCMDMVVYEALISAEGSQPTPHIHDHFEQAVRSILDGMEQKNNGIKELFELLDSKTFTDNQKEKLTWAKLEEVKAYLEIITNQLTGLSISLKKEIFDVADLLKGKIKDHSTLIELKVEESGKDLQYLMEQKFLEQDTKLKEIEETVREVSSSQALLTKAL